MDNNLEMQKGLLRKQIREGEFFKSIFEDELFVSKINEIQNRQFEHWRTSTDINEREKIWNQFQALIELLSELKMPILTIETAKEKLNQLESE